MDPETVSRHNVARRLPGQRGTFTLPFALHLNVFWLANLSVPPYYRFDELFSDLATLGISNRIDISSLT